MAYNYFTNVHLLLTERCNLRCKYCYVDKQPKDMDEKIGYQSIEMIIKGAKKSHQNSIIVTFFGGEPTLKVPLMDKIFDYTIKRCKEEKLFPNFTLITNGMNFSKEFQNFLIKWKKCLGGINVQLSFDGDPETESNNRPFKTINSLGITSGEVMERNLNKIKDFCQKENIQIGSEIFVHSVVSKESLPNLFRNYKYFSEKGFPGLWHILLLEDNWSKEDISIYRNQLELIYNYIIDKKEYTSFLANKIFRKKECQPNLPCTAGRTLCCVNPEGMIYACHRYYQADKTDFLGKINADGTIRINKEKKSFYDNLTTKDFYGEKPCKDCHITNCFRCPAANKEKNNISTLCFPQYCQMAQVEFEMQIKVAAFLKKNNLLPTKSKEQEEMSDEGLLKLVEGLEKLSDVIADSLNQIEDKQNDILNLLVANLLQKED